MTIGFPVAVLPNKPAASAGVSSLIAVDGSGALVQTSKTIVYASDYGAGTAKTGVQNATAIQAAIDALALLGGGMVVFGSGTYTSNPVVLKNGVILVGQGSTATCLKLANNQNTDFITSYGFASLTGQNKWLVSDGVVHGIGFVGMRIDGNKANQSAGYGVKFYAKRLLIKDVMIINCKQTGWYSEAGDVAGQTDWQDLPESHIDLAVRNCDGDGFIFRGPHDAQITKLTVNQCGGKGASFEVSTSVYNGSADILFVHNYANTGVGLNVDADCRLGHIISESNYDEGFTCSSWYAQIRMLELYTNCRTTGTYHCRITGKYVVIDNLQVRNNTQPASGVLFDNAHITVNGGVIDGGNVGTSKVGVTCTQNCDYSHIRLHIVNWVGTTCTGLLTGSGGSNDFCVFDITIDGANTCWNNATSGFSTTFNIKMKAYAGGQVAFTGSGPGTNDTWNVTGDENGTAKLSRITKVSGGTIDLNSTTEQVLTIGCSELLGLTPAIQNCSGILSYTGSNSTWELAYLQVSAVSSTLVTFKVKLRVAAGSAQTANILLRANLTP